MPNYDNKHLIDELKAISDREYALFQAKLTPTLSPECFLGVRVPKLREFAKEFIKRDECKDFLADLPHKYYDENMLHSILLTAEKDFDNAISKVDAFLPFVDNWAVCDTLSPKAFKKNHDKLIGHIYKWTASSEVYTCRFGLEILMNFFLDKDFLPEYLQIPKNIVSDEYYVNMMIAWYFATALAKQWDAVFPIIKEGSLGKFVQNKTISKARESYRITDSQKEILKKYKKI